MNFLAMLTQTTLHGGKLLARFWEELGFDSQGILRHRLAWLPLPCANHIEARLRRPTRARWLKDGCRRLVVWDEQVFLDGLWDNPVELCRAAEAAGPLPSSAWTKLTQDLSQHRLWLAGVLWENSKQASAIKLLLKYRELPQTILDLCETSDAIDGGDTIIWAPYAKSFQRFLLRAKLEALRYACYEATCQLSRCHNSERS